MARSSTRHLAQFLPSSLIKTFFGLARDSTKTVVGTALSSVKTWVGLN